MEIWPHIYAAAPPGQTFRMAFEPWIARRLMTAGGGGFTRVILWMATGAVALSVAVMLLALALMTGFKHEITEKMFGFWGHIHISDPRSIRSYEAVPFGYDPAMVDSIRTIGQVEWSEPAGEGERRIRSRAGVRHVHAYAYLPGILTHDDQLEGIVLKGVGDDFDWASINRFNQETVPWSGLAEDELILSGVTASRMRLKSGDKLIVYFVRNGNQVQRRFTVKGIYKTGLEENDTKFALAHIDRVREVLGWNPEQIGGLEIAVEDVRDLNGITEYIYQEVLPAHLYAETIREKFPSLFEWLELQDINTIVIIALMLAVAVMNMITALLILILERTQMIGVLKSLGARDRSIRQVFLWFALLVTGIGILAGNLLGLGLAWLQGRYKLIRLDEADYYLDYAPTLVLPWHILAVNIGTLGVIALCLIGPSYLVSRINPVKTLHFR